MEGVLVDDLTGFTLQELLKEVFIDKLRLIYFYTLHIQSRDVGLRGFKKKHQINSVLRFLGQCFI